MNIEKLNKLSKEIHQNAIEKGFWAYTNLAEKTMLIISELSEALEADRIDKHADITILADWGNDDFDKNPIFFTQLFKQLIKDSFEDELADVIIRCLDLLAFIKKMPEYLEINKEVFFEGNTAEMLLKCCKGLPEIYDGMIYGGIAYNINTCLNRVFTLCEVKNIDIDRHIELKMRYNKTREKLHGKKY